MTLYKFPPFVVWNINWDGLTNRLSIGQLYTVPIHGQFCEKKTFLVIEKKWNEQLLKKWEVSLQSPYQLYTDGDDGVDEGEGDGCTVHTEEVATLTHSFNSL